MKIPDTSMPWVAIDFETATKAKHSAYQIALVRIEGGRVVGQVSRLIALPSDIGPWEFPNAHGISDRDLRSQPPFSVVWGDVSKSLRGVGFIAAHNAKFDRGVLEACAQYHKVKLPSLPWVCTLDLAQHCWPYLDRGTGSTGFGLASIAAHLRIHLDHHDALSDATACAKVLLAAERVMPPPAVTASTDRWDLIPDHLIVSTRAVDGAVCLRCARCDGIDRYQGAPANLGRWVNRAVDKHSRCWVW